KACHGEYMEGCVVLGVVYQLGLVDFTKAATYYDRGCKGGESSGCVNLALLYRDGTGVPRDEDRARQLIKRACELGANEVCQ
ncbi:MAG TPA: hypothetical protein VIU61_06750, partial [Kofleriaceae bacterium]